MDQDNSAESAAATIRAILTVVDSEMPFSDILVSADEPVMLRNASGWTPFPDSAYSNDDIEFILSSMEPDWQTLLTDTGGFSRPYLVGNWRLRVTAYLANRGDKKMLSIRRTPITPMPLEKTGLSPSVKLMVENPKGLILLSGPTGSGKTTTMAALIDYINSNRSAHVVTIEDPIEYEFVRNKSVFSQREVGADTPSFFEGVRGAMRQRPDVIVIGEIRDRDTAENAILAGESGHLVIATLHASSAYGAVQKLVSFFPGEEMARTAGLATSLMGVIHHAIVPTVDKLTGVLASELLFNHHQGFSGILADSQKVNSELEDPKDKISRSMAASLVDLVKAAKISKSDALRSVAGQGAVWKQVNERLNSVKV